MPSAGNRCRSRGFPLAAGDTRLAASRRIQAGVRGRTLTVDVKGEIEKLLWADVLILQFPLWWFSMPAILKAGSTACSPTASRTVSASTATSVGRPLRRGDVGRQTRDGDRDGGRLAGALFGTRDQRPIDDLLFPINHGILYYPGYEVLPPFVVYKSDKLDGGPLTRRCAESNCAMRISR
jgi:NAD(P)H dehydrogenase (quinone)